MPETEIWMGRGEVRPLPGADPELADATWASALVLAYASSREGFERVLEATLEDDRLELVELEEVGPIGEMWNVGEHIRRALETAETGAPSLWVVHSHVPEDAEDEDEAALRAATAAGDPVRFRRLGGDSYYLGYAVAVSERWGLVNLIERDSVRLDGYAAVRFERVIDVEVLSDSDTFLMRALAQRGERPQDPVVPLDGHKSLLGELSHRYPLVSLGDETMPGVVGIGEIAALGDDRVTLRGVNTLAEWTGEHEHLFENIEMVLFGREYEKALASVVR